MTTTIDADAITDDPGEPAVLKPIPLDHSDIETGEYGEDAAAEVTLCHFIEVKVPNERMNDQCALRLASASVRGVAHINPASVQRFMKQLQAAVEQ